MCVIAASGIGTVLLHGRKTAPAVSTEV
jgi:hypothetical protein